MTMHRGKGTEFSKVVLADAGWQSPAERQCREVIADQR